MPLRLRYIAVAVTAGLAVSAAPAAASEDQPGTPLPSTLTPVTLQPAPVVPTVQPVRAVRPAVLAARLTPRHVRRGRRSRLQVRLATPGRVRVVLERTRHG